MPRKDIELDGRSLTQNALIREQWYDVHGTKREQRKERQINNMIGKEQISSASKASAVNTDKCLPGLARLTWPIFLDVLCVFLVSVSDIWFLSQISDTAAAAVGATLPLLGLSFTLLLNTSLAGNGILCRLIGAGRTSELADAHAAVLLLSLCLGGIIGLALGIAAEPLAAIIGLAENLRPQAVEYLHIISFGAVPLALRYGANAILNAHGRTGLSMISTLLMAVCNIALNYFFVFGPFTPLALGLQGVAFATVMAWSASACCSAIMCLWLLRPKLFRNTGLNRLKVQIAAVIDIAAPSSLEPISWHLSQIVIMYMVVQLGEIALTTRVYVNNVLFLSALFATALSAGVQIKVGHAVGAQRVDDANQHLRAGLGAGLVAALAVVLLLLVFAQHVLGLFTDNAAVIALGSQIIAIALLCECGRAVNMIAGASLKACGDARYVSFWALTIMWLLTVPAAWLLGLHFALGLAGIWLALGVDELARAAIVWRRWQSRRWIKNRAPAKIPVAAPIQPHATPA